MDKVKYFKGYVPHILLGQFLKTMSQMRPLNKWDKDPNPQLAKHDW